MIPIPQYRRDSLRKLGLWWTGAGILNLAIGTLNWIGGNFPYVSLGMGVILLPIGLWFLWQWRKLSGLVKPKSTMADFLDSKNLPPPNPSPLPPQRRVDSSGDRPPECSFTWDCGDSHADHKCMVPLTQHTKDTHV